jgi:hypothetical protein
MDKNGNEVWRFSEDRALWDHPIGAVDVPKGYILVSTAEDWSGSPTPSPSKLVINLVSPRGEPLSRHEYIVADRALLESPSALAVQGGGRNLIVAVNKSRTSAEENLPISVVNPLTGSRRFCSGGNMTTFMDIDINTFDVRSTREVHNRTAKAMKVLNGDTFVAFGTTHECRLERGIELARVDAALNVDPIFDYEGLNDIQLWDFTSLADLFLLSGSVRVQLPTSLLKEVIPFDQITHANPLDPAFWESGEERPNAFVLVGRADGKLIGDRVFPDLRNRSINSVVASGPRQIVGVGAALGDRGWMVVLEPNASLGDRGGTRSSTEVQQH